MTSSMLTTDKRWAAPTRKSGMTVLGKIPKPINLPSQRLENHGLDPNVEIVPKGGLTWGSKVTSTAPNAWGSSSLLSPKNDGGSISPSYLSGRPSSGGGTRPSTAGSEKSSDSPCAWGPNSRPSTASGILPSHHLSMAANRPRSAETRPGSSQLSRFADSSAENIKVSIRTIDKSGAASHGHGFTLSTGDFPTLGSEKNSELNYQRGHSSQGRPASSSGKEKAQNELGRSPITGAGELIPSSNYQHVNSMKTEHAYDGGVPLSTTNLPRDAQPAQPYPPNLCMPPPQFDSWRAPPGHPPEGMWPRRGAPCGPFRPAGPPGSFPVEPYAYYGQFLPNSEAVARPNSGHGGFHPKNGDSYRPHVAPNSYVVNPPVISVRPAYQAPVPYDGYFGPPRASFNNASERDAAFIGGPHQPGILNQYPNQNDKFNPGHSQNRPGKHETMPKEQVESGRVHIAHRGQPMILLEHPARLEDYREAQRKDQLAQPVLPQLDGNLSDVNMRTDISDTFSERDRLVKVAPEQRNFPSTAGKSHSTESEKALAHHRATDEGIVRKKLKDDHSVADDQQPVIKKNVALIEKIESLNNKAKNADARSVVEPFSSREAKTKQPKSIDTKSDHATKDFSSSSIITDACNVVEPFSSKEAKTKQPKSIDTKADHVTKDVSSSSVVVDVAPPTGRATSFSDRNSFPVVQSPPNLPVDAVVIVESTESQVTEVSSAGKLGELTHPHAHKRGNSSRNRRDGPAKDRSANISGHGVKEHPASDSLPVVDVTNAMQDQPSSENASQESRVAVTDEMSDSLDYNAQRMKMKELAAQRAKQRQEEEEERTRQQKAKALAKLEELNRRASAQIQKNSTDTPPQMEDVQQKQEAGVGAASKPDASITESPGVYSDENLSVLLPQNEPINVAASVELKSTKISHSADGVTKDPVIHNGSSSSNSPEINTTEYVAQRIVAQSNESSVPKLKQTGNRRRQVVPQDKLLSEKPSTGGNTEKVKNAAEAYADPPTAAHARHEDSSTQNKKSSRHSRNKKKVDDAPVSSISPPAVLNEENPGKRSSEPKIQSPGVVINSAIVPAQGTTVTVGSITFGDVSLTSLNQEWLKSPEEVHRTEDSCSRQHQPKRPGKNQHGARPVEKSHGNEGVMWAPVRQQSKNVQSGEAGINSAAVASAQSAGKNNSDAENVTRTKRAEMERYVPKPLYEELQQNLGKTALADNHAVSADTTVKSSLDTKNHEKVAFDNSVAAETGVGTEPKKWEDKKTNRGHGRMHASWRRRNADESALVVPSPAEHAASFHETKYVQKPSDEQHPLEPEQHTLEPEENTEKRFKLEGLDATETSSAPTRTVSLPMGAPKEHGATSRQRRHQVRAQRNEGNNYVTNDNKEREGGTEGGYQTRTSVVDLNPSDHRNVSRSEVRSTGAVVHPKAHWKPKSNSHTLSSAQGHNVTDEQMDSHGGRSDMESSSQGFDGSPQGSSLNQKNGGDGQAHGVQGKAEMKYEDDNLRGQSHEDVAEQQLNPTPRRHGQHNGRYTRGGGMYRGRGHDAGKQNLGPNGDRRKGGAHFEYQPVGSYSKPADLQNNLSAEEPMEGDPVSGPVYRDRTHRRGPGPAGHFVRRTGVSTSAATYRDE